MSREKVRRFSKFEIAYHAIQGIIYLTLFLTGTIQLLQRFPEIKIIESALLIQVHIVSGILLMALIGQSVLLMALTPAARVLIDNMRAALNWQSRDFIWLLKVPIQVFYPRLRLPPSDRFNPGHKLHLLMVFSLLIGFSLSGLLMLILPGAFGPWLVHLICFVPAAAFLLLHLFLALINPSTRQSLPSIFTGFVSRKYAAEHHPLWLGLKEAPHHVHIRFSTAALGLILLFVSIAFIVLPKGIPQFLLKAEMMWQQPEQIILPGDLIEGHASDPKLKECTACHSYWERLPSDKCISCHGEIALAQENNSGYHGTLTGSCRSCHKDHLGADADIRPLDPESFNHQLARYPLQGKHARIDCEACHAVPLANASPDLRIKYREVPFQTCDACHPNIHETADYSDCLKCHDQEGWNGKNLRFVHNRDSSYLLTGKHIDASCDDCHPRTCDPNENPVIFYIETPIACIGCHEDPHADQLDKNCANCHDEQNWGNWRRLFSHNSKDTYKLDALHADRDCFTCHTGLPKERYRTLPNTCEGCHKDVEQAFSGKAGLVTVASDPHADRVACIQCHATEQISQSADEFAAQCQSCHNPFYADLFFEWSRAFLQRSQKAKAVPAKIEDNSTLVYSDASDSILDIAHKVRFHNINLARRLYDNATSGPVRLEGGED